MYKYCSVYYYLCLISATCVHISTALATTVEYGSRYLYSNNNILSIYGEFPITIYCISSNRRPTHVTEI